MRAAAAGRKVAEVSPLDFLDGAARARFAHHAHGVAAGHDGVFRFGVAEIGGKLRAGEQHLRHLHFRLRVGRDVVRPFLFGKHFRGKDFPGLHKTPLKNCPRAADFCGAEHLSIVHYNAMRWNLQAKFAQKRASVPVKRPKMSGRRRRCACSPP